MFRCCDGLDYCPGIIVRDDDFWLLHLLCFAIWWFKRSLHSSVLISGLRRHCFSLSNFIILSTFLFAIVIFQFLGSILRDFLLFKISVLGGWSQLLEKFSSRFRLGLSLFFSLIKFHIYWTRHLVVSFLCRSFRNLCAIYCYTIYKWLMLQLSSASGYWTDEVLFRPSRGGTMAEKITVVSQWLNWLFHCWGCSAAPAVMGLWVLVGYSLACLEF